MVYSSLKQKKYYSKKFTFNDYNCSQMNSYIAVENQTSWIIQYLKLDFVRLYPK